MKNITAIILILSIYCNIISAQTTKEIPIWPTVPLWVDEINNSTDDIICLVGTAIGAETITVEKSIVLKDGKTLVIPNLVTLDLINGSTITMEGTGTTIKGSHYKSSKITYNGEDGSAITMDNCQGCKIEEINITGDKPENGDIEDGCGTADLCHSGYQLCNGADHPLIPICLREGCIKKQNATGVTINNNSEGNEFSSVNIEHLKVGIMVNSNGNTFEDLQFMHVGLTQAHIYALEDPNCIGSDCPRQSGCDEDDVCAGHGSLTQGAGIWIENADNNKIINVFHSQSPGAITILFNEVCNGNEAIGISVEQELSVCASPAIYADGTAWGSENNYIVDNYNGAWVPPGTKAILCPNNTIISVHNQGLIECKHATQTITACP